MAFLMTAPVVSRRWLFLEGLCKEREGTDEQDGVQQGNHCHRQKWQVSVPRYHVGTASQTESVRRLMSCSANIRCFLCIAKS